MDIGLSIGRQTARRDTYTTCANERTMLVGIIAWILIGLIAGAIAKALTPGKDPGGCLVTMLIGIVGGLLGGWLGKVIFGVHSINGFFHLSTWIAAVLGSVVVLIIYRLLTGGRSR